MKYLRNSLWSLSLLIIGGVMLLSGCDKKTEISTADAVKAKLTASTWNLKSVDVSGTDQTSVYKGLTLTFTPTSFTTTNGGVVWPVTGTWEFKTPEATTIVRDDKLELTIQEVTDTSLKLALTWTKTTFDKTGRLESVSGAHTFTFTK
jgi:hypothetical protein